MKHCGISIKPKPPTRRIKYKDNPAYKAQIKKTIREQQAMAESIRLYAK
ncbi:MAG: hypothetical protein Q7U38_17825 [Methylobacter sp.]|nr:hypothetical protein [Methylobacter sp.]MDP2099128.1 hypothetical protein [Methylobacter sp.]MDP2429954.1 hypothetical protein [Methylobacter sp.]MDP3054799.1 hypothetical protein [Methylobacter sp.]MDP3361217.1 hypothetical protein [Methylobacter sp.]